VIRYFSGLPNRFASSTDSSLRSASVFSGGGSSAEVDILMSGMGRIIAAIARRARAHASGLGRADVLLGVGLGVRLHVRLHVLWGRGVGRAVLARRFGGRAFQTLVLRQQAELDATVLLFADLV